MFSMRSNPIFAAAAIVLLLNAQFMHVSHVHPDMAGVDKSEHESRPHVHMGHSHQHSHAHGHSHSHSHSSPPRAKQPAKSTKSSVPTCAAEHDQDAVYLSNVVAIATTSQETGKSQLIDTVFYSCGNDRLEVLSNVVPQRQHPPDTSQSLATYLLKQAILC